MAINREASGVSIEAIVEYLRASELCLNFRKGDGGCLGYPATLLLFCVVDALGRYLALNKKNKIPKGEPFFVLKHACFGMSITQAQIKKLELWYRNGLTHNAALTPGVCLSGEAGDPFDFAANGDPIKIRVFAFHDLVKRVWAGFDKKQVNPSAVLTKLRMPTLGFDSSESLASPIASSGCPLPPGIPNR